MQKDGRRLGTAALVAGALGISASAVLNKLAIGTGLHPIWLNILRVGLALAVMLPFFLRKREAVQALRSAPRRERWLTALAGVMLAVHFATWTYALAYADSVVAVTIWSTCSLMTVVGSSLFLGERTPLPALLGIMLALCGVGVLAIGASESQLLGVLMALGAAVTQAVYTLCGRVVRRKIDMLPNTTMVYAVSLGCLLLCALALRVPTDGMAWESVGAGFLLALVCTLGGHSMQSYALKYHKAPTVSTAMLTEVITGPLLVFLVLGEVPKLVSVIGGVMILIGVGWYMLYEWKHMFGSEALT